MLDFFQLIMKGNQENAKLACLNGHIKFIKAANIFARAMMILMAVSVHMVPLLVIFRNIGETACVDA